MSKTFERLLETIDAKWIADNPYVTYDLIKGLISDIEHYKDVVQIQRETILFSSAVIETMKGKYESDVE